MGDDTTAIYKAFTGAELETALAAAGVGVWAWDLNAGRIRWSPETCRLFETSLAQAELSFDDLRARIHPEDVDAVEALVRHALSIKSQDFVMEHRIALTNTVIENATLASAGVRWVEARGRVVLDADGVPYGMIGAVLDVTARKESSERLQRSEERFRLFTEMASDYVYIVDMRQPALAPLIVAGSFERTTGYTPEDVVAAGGWMQIIHPDDRKSAEELAQVLQHGRTFVNEYRIRSKSGEIVWLRDRVQPILDPTTGELLQLVGGVQDITERKTLAEQLGHAYKLEALARLAGSVAHDFNNLLTVMFSATAMIDPKAAEGRNDAALSDLNQAINRAAELTASLLAFARKRPTVPRVSLLRDALVAVTPMLQRAVGERIVVHVDVSRADAAARISVDTSQLEVALLNLAINARDAMQQGELRVIGSVVDFTGNDRQRPPELAPARYAAIDVIDTGTGIAPEVRARLFEPFFTTKEGKGTGLGLATVHGLVRQSGGAVGVETQLGKGSTFTVYLPLAAAPVGAKEQSGPRASIGGTERVIVVEDQPMVRRMVVRVLEDLGYRVTSYPCAEDALALSDEQWAGVDLLLTDIRLPGLAGTDLALALSDRRPEVAVILMSGFIDDPAQQELVSSGRYRLLSKPFVPDGLARCVRETLERKRRSSL